MTKKTIQQNTKTKQQNNPNSHYLPFTPLTTLTNKNERKPPNLNPHIP